MIDSGLIVAASRIEVDEVAGGNRDGADAIHEIRGRDGHVGEGLDEHVAASEELVQLGAREVAAAGELRQDRAALLGRIGDELAGLVGGDPALVRGIGHCPRHGSGGHLPRSAAPI